MRDFFITWMERLLGLFVILSILGLIAAAVTTGMSDRPNAAITAVAMLVGGAVSIILTFGFAYIALGIYANTRRTAEAVEAMARGGDGRLPASALVPQSGPVRRAGPPVVQGPAVQGPVRPGNLRR